ncbi:MAG: nucleotidyltransferase family protein [Pseudomonadota bacterium]
MEEFTALILAASRAGAQDEVAKLQGVSHKCLVKIDGEVMLERVVNAISASRYVGRIYVSIESESILREAPGLAAALDSGKIHFLPSGDNLFVSVKEGAEAIADAYPLLISTGDNALHTTEYIDHFCKNILSTQGDGFAGFTPAQTILDAYPDGKRAFHELKDGGWSSCNLYSLNNDKALKAAQAFETGGQFGKQPRRLLKAMGLGFVIKYKFKLTTLAGLTEHLSRRWNLKLAPIVMPFADAPIDVDNVGDFHRTEEILKKRRSARAV